jgi:hypothetical protein
MPLPVRTAELRPVLRVRGGYNKQQRGKLSDDTDWKEFHRQSQNTDYSDYTDY